MVRPAAKLIILTLFLLALSTNAWAVLQCAENLAGGATILRLSAQTNAHGEISTQSNYSVDIRCRETTGVSVGPTQANLITILKLSSPTNAHAEYSGATNYSTLIQIGDNAGGQISTTIADSSAGSDNDCDDFDTATADYVEVVRLSDLTNAHLQSPAYVGTAYRYRICAAYDTSGSAASSNILDVSFPTGSVNIGQGQIFATTANMNLQISPAQGYSQLDSLQGIAICDVANPACSALAISDYTTVRNEFVAFATSNPGTYAGPFIPQSVQLSIYGDDYQATYNSFRNNWVGNPGNNFTSLENQPIPHLVNYSFDTAAAGTPAGAYRVILLGLRASYTYNAVPGVESDLVANWTTMDLVIDALNCGNGVIEPLLGEMCDPPGSSTGCPSGLVCNGTCTACSPGGGTTGTAGDVFILRDIKFPNVYQNSDVVADVVVENKRMDLTTSGTISFIIRDSKGVLVPGFSVPTNFSFGSSLETVRLILQNPCSGTACAFNTGETYTLYATVVPYDDPLPSLDEKVVANNSGYKTFTSLEAPQTYAIPDSPWWMSVLVFGMIAGWLFISARKNEN